MPGYVIADVTVTDPETYADYRALTPGSIAAFDGRFLVRGGEHEVIAGGWQPGRFVYCWSSKAPREPQPGTIRRPTWKRGRSASAHRPATWSISKATAPHRVAAITSSCAARPKTPDIDLANVAAHGGRVLSSGRAPAIKEGTWPHGRMTVLEFDDRAAAAGLA